MKSTIRFAALLLAFAAAADAQKVTSPTQQFGKPIGADYFLINYSQFLDYWNKLDRESDRMRIVRIGTSAEGRPMPMAIVTAPENFKKLARYQEISQKLAHAENLSDDQAHALAREGRIIVWIDGGLHASEVLGSHQLVQTTYDLLSRNDPETLRILHDDIILLVAANPDGWDLLGNWYMRQPDTLKRSTQGVPVLYQKYVGHDNNRDAYMAAMPETQAMDSILFRAWYPQIMYNHHQPGPRAEGFILFAPPFRDPFNYNFDPLVVSELDLVGAAMHSRFVAEGKPGATMRTGSNYSTWFNGGMRTTTYFHNMIGLLTETSGNPTPMQIDFVPDRLLPSGITPFPVTPKTLHFSEVIDYSVTANRAVLDIASRYRETFLYNMYKMGRNSIERGSRDNWTLTPHKLAAFKTVYAVDTAAKKTKTAAEYLAMLRRPDNRDPRGYIIPSSQPDFPTAVKFINTFVKTGITVLRATKDFTVAGKNYPAGSFVVKTDQAFRPHVLDMFEPQDHPDDIPYPGASPIPPYDNAGWTLAYQMGIQFDRILDGFSGPFERLNGYAVVPAVPGLRSSSKDHLRPQSFNPDGYYITRATNDAFVLINRALASGLSVSTLTAPVTIYNESFPVGTFFVGGSAKAMAVLGKASQEKGVPISFQPGPDAPKAVPIKPVRIALWDSYGGSIRSGWTRFLLEQFEFPYTLVFPPDIDSGKLIGNYDVLILPDNATIGRTLRSNEDNVSVPRDTSLIPAEYKRRIGIMTVSKTLPAIRAFLNSGGTVLAMGNASIIGTQLGLPIADALVDSTGKLIPRAKFYVPASVLRVAVDTTDIVALGMHRDTDVFYDNNPAFKLLPGADSAGVRKIAWFDSPTPLRSGWAWGQALLNGAVEVLSAPVGKGRLVLFGPDIQFRHQSQGTFKFLFNGIYPAAGR